MRSAARISIGGTSVGPTAVRPGTDGTTEKAAPCRTAPVVEALDLVKTYPGGRGRPDVRALDGLTLTIPAGTVHGLLGPNGAGKSTTTKVLTTLARATSGTARVAGHDVVREAARRPPGHRLRVPGHRRRPAADARARTSSWPPGCAGCPGRPRPTGRGTRRPVRSRRGRRPRRGQALRRHPAQARRGPRPRRHPVRCCSSTSRPPGSTPRRAPRCGRRSGGSPARTR